MITCRGLCEDAWRDLNVGTKDERMVNKNKDDALVAMSFRPKRGSHLTSLT